MGYYGGWSLKPQLGLSNAIWAGYLNEPVSTESRKWLKEKAKDAGKALVKVTVSKNSNKVSVTGTKDLKRSQEYPRSFGQRVAECHLKYMSSDIPNPNLLQFIKTHGYQEPPQDCWKFAALEPMVEFIRLAMRSGFTPDPDIPLQIQPCRRTAELAIKRALEP